MYRHRTSCTLAAILLFAAVVVAANALGHRSRVFAPTRTTHVVASPQEAAQIWEEKQVKGRTLLLFDDFPHDLAVEPLDGQPPPSRLVRHGIFRNVVRRIYLVVPDARWEEFQRGASMYGFLREVPGIARARYLFTLSGVPTIAVNASSLPSLREDALVYVNDGAFDYAQAAALLARKGITSDVMVWRR